MFFYFSQSSGIGEPSVYHALVVIFLEFFAWGLLTMPVINVSNPQHPIHGNPTFVHCNKLVGCTPFDSGESFYAIGWNYS